jgi:sugar phosphate isomerase/epimerase
MSSYSRREFGKVVAASMPLAMALSRGRLFASSGEVALGATTRSFRELPRVEGADDLDVPIPALKAAGVTRVELASEDLEPAPPNDGPGAPPKNPAYPAKVTLSPQQIAIARAQVRYGLRQFRLRTTADMYALARKSFSTAGIDVFALALVYDDEFTDEEVDKTFFQAESLGARVLTTDASMTIANRLAPFAAKHNLLVAFQNQGDPKVPGAVTRPEQFGELLALSKNYRIKLDVGHLTAMNLDAVKVLSDNLDRVTHVQIQDRMRNNGRSEPFGEGDTPIAAVINVLAHADRAIPAFVDYNYSGLLTASEEIATSLRFVKNTIVP